LGEEKKIRQKSIALPAGGGRENVKPEVPGLYPTKISQCAKKKITIGKKNMRVIEPHFHEKNSEGEN